MPANQPVKTARIERENNGRKNLQNPDAAEQLQIDCIFGRQEDNKCQCAEFDQQRRQFCIFVSCAGVTLWDTKGLYKLRVNRLAAPIDITAAGTSALIAIAAAEKPRNQEGKSRLISAGTTSELASG